MIICGNSHPLVPVMIPITLLPRRVGGRVRRPTHWRETMMALTTFAIGMMLFGLFFALVVACDRI
jgi:hypothetical protein